MSWPWRHAQQRRPDLDLEVRALEQEPRRAVGVAVEQGRDRAFARLGIGDESALRPFLARSLERLPGIAVDEGQAGDAALGGQYQRLAERRRAEAVADLEVRALALVFAWASSPRR